MFSSAVYSYLYAPVACVVAEPTRRDIFWSAAASSVAGGAAPGLRSYTETTRPGTPNFVWSLRTWPDTEKVRLAAIGQLLLLWDLGASGVDELCAHRLVLST